MNDNDNNNNNRLNSTISFAAFDWLFLSSFRYTDPGGKTKTKNRSEKSAVPVKPEKEYQCNLF